MVHEYKLIEEEEAYSLRDRLDLLEDAYYLDRSKFRPIRGIENHEIGSYHCIGDKSLPKDLCFTFWSLGNYIFMAFRKLISCCMAR